MKKLLTAAEHNNNPYSIIDLQDDEFLAGNIVIKD
jgi:hypothetical protein